MNTPFNPQTHAHTARSIHDTAQTTAVLLLTALANHHHYLHPATPSPTATTSPAALTAQKVNWIATKLAQFRQQMDNLANCLDALLLPPSHGVAAVAARVRILVENGLESCRRDIEGFKRTVASSSEGGPGRMEEMLASGFFAAEGAERWERWLVAWAGVWVLVGQVLGGDVADQEIKMRHVDAGKLVRAAEAASGEEVDLELQFGRWNGESQVNGGLPN